MRAAVLGLVGLGMCAAVSPRGAAAQAGWPAVPPSQAPSGSQPAGQPPAVPVPADGPPASSAQPSAPSASPANQPPQSPPMAPPGAPPSSPPPPSYGPGQPPPPPPAAPYYQRLGTSEPEIEKGDWDPWEHPTADQHDHDGFFMRLALGFGGGSVWGNHHVLPGVTEVTLTGLGFGSEIAVGGAVANNLILNADLFQTSLFNPSVHKDGQHLGSASDLPRLGSDLGVGQDVTLAGFGIGLTYYFMPANVYLAGSVGLGQAVFEDFNGSRSGSDFGFAANVMLGKEWWVGPDWGIGVAGQLIIVAAHDDILGPLDGTVFNLLFSATYN